MITFICRRPDHDNDHCFLVYDVERKQASHLHFTPGSPFYDLTESQFGVGDVVEDGYFVIGCFDAYQDQGETIPTNLILESDEEVIANFEVIFRESEETWRALAESARQEVHH